MATIDIGKIKPVFKGTYDNSVSYVLDDIVYYNGSSYVAKTSTTGNLPTDTTKWNILASGSGGIYDSTLSIGTANQVLAVSSGGALEFQDASGGKTLNVVQHTNSTRTSLPSQADYTFFQVTYPQQKANSKILIQAQMPGQGGEAGNVHMKAVYDGTDYDGVGWYAYTDGGHGQLMHFFHLLNGASTTGNKTLTLKQNSKSGSQKFATIWNPNSTDDNRLGQSMSSLVIIEYDF